MKTETIKGYGKQSVLQLLKAAVDAEPNQKTFAEKHGIDPATLSSVLKGYRPPSSTILDILGLEAIYVCVPKPEPESANA